MNKYGGDKRSYTVCCGVYKYSPWLKVIQEDFSFEFKDEKWVHWCNKYLHENSWFLQCASLVLAKRIHFPTKSSWLLIAGLQRLRSKEKGISDNWILLKWLSVEHACIPHICHQSHQYICGEKNCHVEKFQISMHDKCGDFWNFSTCRVISNLSTWQMWRNLNFLHMWSNFRFLLVTDV